MDDKTKFTIIVIAFDASPQGSKIHACIFALTYGSESFQSRPRKFFTAALRVNDAPSFPNFSTRERGSVIPQFALVRPQCPTYNVLFSVADSFFFLPFRQLLDLRKATGNNHFEMIALLRLARHG